MAIQFLCPQCDATIKVPDSASGKIGRCPKCETRLKVPEIDLPQPVSGPAAEPPGPADPPAAAAKNPLLSDHSAVFVLPRNAQPAESPAPAAAVPAPPPPSPNHAREEYEQGRAWLAKPVVPGAGWPAADRAVGHFTRAAELDPDNLDYATQAGVACQQSIERFLESWGRGAVVSVAAFHAGDSIGQEIDRTERIFLPSGLSADNLKLLRERANEGLRWYERALTLDPGDAVARCRRASLLCSVGAFSAALADARAALASPLVPSKTRDEVQRITDFILGEDSPLRKYLTRSEAQQLQGPPGVTLPGPAPSASATSSDPEPFPIRFDANPLTPPALGADATIAEIPLVGPVAVQAHTAPIASRLRKKRSNVWSFVIPLVFLGVLLGLAYAYVRANRVTFTGNLSGEDVSAATLRKSISASELGTSTDDIQALLTALREEPETIRTGLRVITLRGTPSALEVSLHTGESGRLVRVDLRSHSPLNAFATEHAAKLEGPVQQFRTATLQQFAKDFAAAQSGGMKLGNLESTYLDAFGGDLLVGGLGYRLMAEGAGQLYPCVYEDEEGKLYFLVPRTLAAFDVIERKPEETPSVFETEFGYHVTVTAGSAAAEAAPAEPAAPTAEPPPAGAN